VPASPPHVCVPPAELSYDDGTLHAALQDDPYVLVTEGLRGQLLPAVSATAAGVLVSVSAVEKGGFGMVRDSFVHPQIIEAPKFSPTNQFVYRQTDRQTDAKPVVCTHGIACTFVYLSILVRSCRTLRRSPVSVSSCVMSSPT
jgi:hypothetical protein